MLLRIGEKIVNCAKIYKTVGDMLEMRSQGMSQQEVANRVGVDRTLISRLETLGEVRKGGRIAIIGFPLKNCDELAKMALQEGVEYCLLLSESQRWEFVESKSGIALFNTIMEVIAILRKMDTVIIIGSNKRIKLMEALLDKDVIGIQIGESPIAEDKYVDREEVRSIIRELHS